MVAFLMSVSAIIAQSHTISGVVLDDQNDPLPGASVIVKGTEGSPVGTITSIDGSFSLEMPDGHPILIVSFIGFDNQEVDVTGKQNVSIQMKSDTENLEEVVVTALGIKREKKALGYSVQDVKGDALESSSRLTPIDALSGKVSGLNISTSGNGPGGSTKVLIRGANSLTGGNDPLYVIDGVPLDNSGGASGGQYGGFDYGNAANNINPDDIESISVLKGGAASALYGSRGQNGVIMITTKKGSQNEGLGVSISSSYEFSDPLIKPDYQNQYSQGSNGKFNAGEYRSWGAKMTGQTETNFLNQAQVLNTNNEHPYDAFLRTGSTWNNTVTINKRNELSGVYFSASRMDNKSMLPNSDYEKNSFTVRFDTQLSAFLKLDTKANYIYQEASNRPNLAGSPDNVIYLMNVMPRSVTMSQLSPYQTVDGYPVVWNSNYQNNDDGSVSWRGAPPVFASSPLLQNPYWATALNQNDDNRSRLIGFAELSLDFKEWFSLGFDLSLKGKAGVDYYTDNRKRYTADKTYYKADGRASITQSKTEIREENYDFLLTIGDQWNGFRAQGSVGANLMHRKVRSVNTGSEAGLINEVGPYVIQNFLNPITSEGISDQEIQSIYGLFSFDYKSKVFLDVTLRNDWTSVLSEANRSYLYPSAGLSWIVSETLTLPNFVNFLKLRTSYAGVGNGGNYASYRYIQYVTNPNQFHGLPYANRYPDRRPEPDLKSEYTESIEFGLNSSLFNNKLKLDLTYYQTGTKDQILTPPMAPSSGYNSGVFNAGYIKNTGIEVSISGTVYQHNNWTVDLGANITRQWSDVEELHEEIDILTLGGAGGVIVAAKPGEPVGILMGSAYERDEQGRIVIDQENLPKIKSTEDGAIDYDQIIGNAYPEWLIGLNGNVKYKNLMLSFQIDSKFGHELFSMTNQRGAEYGTLAFTTEGRDEWEKAKKISEITGVPPTNGYMVHGVKNGVEGDYPVDPQKYWDRVTRVGEEFIYDASYIRLRQLAVNYSFGNNLMDSMPFDNLSIGMAVNNLAYLYKQTDNISPESSFGTGNAVGYEMFSFPEARTVSFNLKVNF